MNVPLVLLNRRRRGSVGYNPAGLFALNEPGIWLDPSDLTTMFQDRAGTTAVTTPGQSVGYRRDKSGRNNHAVANSDAARGIYGIEPLGGRRNLLTFTEQFDNAAWTKLRLNVTANATPSPDGTTTADHLIDTAASGTHVAIQLLTKAASAITYTASVYLKAAARTKAEFRVSDQAGNGVRVAVDLSDGSVGAATGFGTGFTSASAAIQAIGNGWYRVTLTATSNSATSLGHEVYVCDASGNTSYVGDGTSGIYAWGAQLETGSTATAYQRVVDQYNVTEAGKQTLHYVQYDGSDDGYVTPTITPGTDKVQVWAAIRKLSDSARGTILELSSSIASNNGAMQLTAPNAASATYAFESKGTALADAVATPFAAPLTSILTGLGDISGDVSRLRVNGTQAATSSADQGTGNFLAYPLYIGRRAGTSLPFNGRDYGLVVRFGANLDASTIAATESWLNQKTGAY